MSVFLSTMDDRKRGGLKFDFNTQLSGAVNNTFKADKTVFPQVLTVSVSVTKQTIFFSPFFQTTENFFFFIRHVCRITFLLKVGDLPGLCVEEGSCR